MLGELRKCCAGWKQRWIFAIMCFLALFNAYAMRVCLSIAITRMVVPVNVPEDEVLDDTCASLDSGPSTPVNETATGGTYEWSEYTQGLILSSFYYGYVLTHPVGGFLAERYGGKHTLGIGILLTAIFTLLTPAAIEWGGSSALIALRILMGLGEGTTYPAVNVLLAKWTPPEERSRTGSFVYAGALIGSIYATTVSGIILQYSDSGGWPRVFYVIGTTSIIWFLVWIVTCYNSPRDHPFIGKNEANWLKERMSEHCNHERPSRVPWRHILSSKPLWAVIIALIGFNYSILTIVTDFPKYLSGVLKFSVQNNGYLSSLIFLCMWIGGTLTSWLSDHFIAKGVSITKVRKIGSILALTGSATFIVSASYAGCNKVLVVTMMVIAMTMMGTAFPSVMVNGLDLSPNFAGTLMAMTNGLSALTGIVSPYIIGVMTTNQTLKEWRLVFWILFGVSVVSNLIFLVYGSGEVEYWNDPDFVKEDYEKRRKKRTEEIKI